MQVLLKFGELVRLRRGEQEISQTCYRAAISLRMA